ILSFIIPAYMVRCMCGWKQTWEVWPALLVAGGSFAVFQFTFATIHAYLPRLVLYPMTDIGGGIFSLVVTAIFLRFWKPKEEWHFQASGGRQPPVEDSQQGADAPRSPRNQGADAPRSPPSTAHGELPVFADPKMGLPEAPLTFGSVTLAWMPYAIMSILLLLSGILRQVEEDWKKSYFKEGEPIPSVAG